MPADYHTHTPLCKHADGEPEAFVRKAVEANLNEYGIADHAPMPNEPFDDWRMDFAELDNYFRWIDRARIEGEKHQLPVRAGLECDWLPGIEEWTLKLREIYPWDYLIGSVHYLDNWDFDNPKWLGHWQNIDPDEVWRRYFEAYAEMARSGLFDILAHPDLIKKFNARPPGDLRRYYAPVIQAIAESKACIELNTAGWHKPCQDAYPALDFLRMAHEAKIPLVISSDAHHPNEVGRDFNQAIQLAKAAGYTHTQQFHKGKSQAVPL